jgi:hypothetical protein
MIALPVLKTRQAAECASGNRTFTRTFQAEIRSPRIRSANKKQFFDNTVSRRGKDLV